eukprot:scaffold9441_cov167-Amphora_coffeaeformis.AAC.4
MAMVNRGVRCFCGLKANICEVGINFYGVISSQPPLMILHVNARRTILLPEYLQCSGRFANICELSITTAPGPLFGMRTLSPSTASLLPITSPGNSMTCITFSASKRAGNSCNLSATAAYTQNVGGPRNAFSEQHLGTSSHHASSPSQPSNINGFLAAFGDDLPLSSSRTYLSISPFQRRLILLRKMRTSFVRLLSSYNNKRKNVIHVMRSLSSSSPSSDKTSISPFAVLSTFRHERTGEPLRPVGLQWNLPGESHITFVPIRKTGARVDTSSPAVRRGIIEAYNRWTFAREETFGCVDDIANVSMTDDEIITVEWKDTLQERHFHEEIFGSAVADLLQKEPTAQQDGLSPVEVWINGRFVGNLCGPESLPPILQALSVVTSRRLAYKRSDDGKFIRIERYFGSYLRQKNEIFDHIMDNLIAMEDIEILDAQTLIGNATLCDWIMTGTLTSRMWIREMDDRIRFLRPLHNDDIQTSDRKFDLIRGTVDDEMIALVEAELVRLRYLGTLSHPFVPPENVESDPLEDIRKKIQVNKPRRKNFGL